MGFDFVVDKLADGMQRCISRHRPDFHVLPVRL